MVILNLDQRVLSHSYSLFPTPPVMLISKAVRLFTVLGFVTLPGLSLSIGAAHAQTFTVSQIEEIMPAVPDTSDFRPLAQENLVLSVGHGQRLMQEAQAAFSAENYTVAAQKLQEARQVFNQLSNLYQDLLNSFNGVDSRIANGLRQQAFETTQLRDEASYQLALVHRAQNQPDLSVPLLIQIIRSQQPTRDLGQRAYRQLFELGFVDSPFPRTQPADPTSSIPQ